MPSLIYNRGELEKISRVQFNKSENNFVTISQVRMMMMMMLLLLLCYFQFLFNQQFSSFVLSFRRNTTFKSLAFIWVQLYVGYRLVFFSKSTWQRMHARKRLQPVCRTTSIASNYLLQL